MGGTMLDPPVQSVALYWFNRDKQDMEGTLIRPPLPSAAVQGPNQVSHLRPAIFPAQRAMLSGTGSQQCQMMDTNNRDQHIIIKAAVASHQAPR